MKLSLLFALACKNSIPTTASSLEISDTVKKKRFKFSLREQKYNTHNTTLRVSSERSSRNFYSKTSHFAARSIHKNSFLQPPTAGSFYFFFFRLHDRAELLFALGSFVSSRRVASRRRNNLAHYTCVGLVVVANFLAVAATRRKERKRGEARYLRAVTHR